MIDIIHKPGLYEFTSDGINVECFFSKEKIFESESEGRHGSNRVGK
jgi:hypothetical protein